MNSQPNRTEHGPEPTARRSETEHRDIVEPVPGPMKTMGAPVEHLDLATVIKVSQAISSEIVLEKLIDSLMRTALQQAGADRGALLLSQMGALRIAAEATTDGSEMVVSLDNQS